MRFSLHKHTRHPSAISRRLVLGIAAILILGARLNAEESREYQVKAGFLFRFTSFVDWPQGAFADAKAPITICVFGDDPFGIEFDAAVRGEKVHGRSIVIKRTRDIREAENSQIVFVCLSERARSAEVLSRIADKNILTVGEHENFIRQGGIVRFYINEEGKVRFEINRAAARRAKLRISSELLKVARVVDE